MIEQKDMHNPPKTGAGESSTELYLRIGEVAEQTGLTQRTIRYYEERGLLPPPGRTQGDFRLYSARDVERLQEVSRLKDLLGFSLAEIKKIAEAEESIAQLRSEFRATGDRGTRLALVDDALSVTSAQLDLLERKLGQMRVMQVELEARKARYLAKRSELLQAPEPAGKR